MFEAGMSRQRRPGAGDDHGKKRHTQRSTEKLDTQAQITLWVEKGKRNEEEHPKQALNLEAAPIKLPCFRESQQQMSSVKK